MVRSIPFIERRRFARHPATGFACAVGHPRDRGDATLATLNLCDLSGGGLSADTACRLPLSGSVTVMLPPDAASCLPAHSRVGRVIRCQPTGNQFRVAVAFDEPPMAAG
ncbi:MAG: hypothetical protein BIFFINMI_00238 [Phycisphaerae bacterium]|nr:hypothetical protein [Phycisphaerae bacterium]